MTILTSQTVVGIDIAKAEVVVYRYDLQTTDTIKMTEHPSNAGLKRCRPKCSSRRSNQHLPLDTVELAHAMGHQVYVVDAYRVSNYRRGIGQRAKNDPCDARLLARYLTNEQHELRLWSPPPKAYTTLKSLLHRRATLVKNHTGLMLSWHDEPLLKKRWPLSKGVRTGDSGHSEVATKSQQRSGN
ncbi:transposase [Pseudomonas hefeiensis]|uniref:IS110 family transposase n=1 Tax=Pseudomonas hefeiensis TaxID=2738125 RepID=UPI0027357CE2|nr:transposase [Pseudomonas sp. FP53]WLH97709.1 transposase [Pseudomonas sp. FP53]